MNNRLAQVRSVVMDRSTPPIQYAPRNASRSNVVSLLMSSKESHAVFTVSRTLNSLHRTPESSFRFCFARSTFAVRSSVFLMLPNAGLAFAHAAGSVHSLRSSSSYRTGRKWGSVIAPCDIAAVSYLYNGKRSALHKCSDCVFRELEFFRGFLDGQCGFLHGRAPFL